MRISRPSLRLLLSLSLLLFQVQVLAAGMLGCRHAAPGAQQPSAAALLGGAGPGQAGCPFHLGDGAQADAANGALPGDRQAPASPLGCAKCALACAIGVCGPTPANGTPPIPHQACARCGRPPPHFYRFSPEADLRPPIAPLPIDQV